jgi:hypothetical protein
MRAWVEDVKTQCVLPVLSKRSFLTSVAEDVCRLMAPIL